MSVPGVEIKPLQEVTSLIQASNTRLHWPPKSEIQGLNLSLSKWSSHPSMHERLAATLGYPDHPNQKSKGWIWASPSGHLTHRCMKFLQQHSATLTIQIKNPRVEFKPLQVVISPIDAWKARSNTRLHWPSKSEIQMLNLSLSKWSSLPSMHETLGYAGGLDGDSRVEVKPFPVKHNDHPSMHATLGSSDCAYVNL